MSAKVLNSRTGGMTMDLWPALGLQGEVEAQRSQELKGWGGAAAGFGVEFGEG